MRHFDRLLNFFASIYNNNTRFHHSTLGYLKIFFERNNKMKSTFSNLGNVFRNSKWSDLKVQNIKTSFVKSWTSYFLYTTLILLVVVPFLGSYVGGIITSNVPILGELYEMLSFYWSHFEDLFRSALVTLFSLLAFIKSFLFNRLYVRSNPVTNFFTTTPNSNFKHNRSFSITRNLHVNTTPLGVMHGYSTLSKSMNNLQSSPELIADYNLNSHNGIFTESSTKLSNLYDNSVSSIEDSYALVPKKSSLTFQLDSNSTDISLINSYNTALSMTNLNTRKGLKSSKEDRWLLRNSLLSENLVLNSNAFTQSKKLLGVNMLNSSSSQKNVWSSTKLGSLSGEASGNFISNTQELFLNKSLNNSVLDQFNTGSPSLDNFNFFENSRMWVTKKYFFTNQLKNNINTLTSSGLGNTATSKQDSDQLFNLLVSHNNQNLIKQLTYLNLNLNQTSTHFSKILNSSTYDIYLNGGDTDLLKLNNISFLNKLTYSTSNSNLYYFSTLIQFTTDKESNTDLSFRK